MPSLCSLRHRAHKLSSSLFLTHCLWGSEGTEGIPKSLEIPARSLSAPLVPGYHWLLGTWGLVLAVPIKGIELSLAQGKVRRGWRKLQTWEHEHPSSFFHSWSLLAIFSPQDCSSVCPLPPCSLDVLDSFLQLCFICGTVSSSSLEGAGERSWGQPQGWEKKAGLECHWRASRFSKPWDLIPEPQVLPAVPCLLLILVCKNLTLTQPSIPVPAITMTRVIRDSYHSAQNRFEAEPLSCTPPPPPPHICRSSTGTQQLGLLESKDDSSGFRCLQRYIPQPSSPS